MDVSLLSAIAHIACVWVANSLIDSCMTKLAGPSLCKHPRLNPLQRPLRVNIHTAAFLQPLLMQASLSCFRKITYNSDLAAPSACMYPHLNYKSPFSMQVSHLNS